MDSLYNKNIIIIHNDPSVYNLKMLKEAGANLFVIGKGEKIVDFANFYKLNPFDHKSLLKLVDNINKEFPVHAVIPLWEGTVYETALVAEHLTLKGNSVESSIISRDKFLTHNALENKGIYTPKTYKVDSVHEIKKIISLPKQYPIILKLPSSTNSQSVTKVNCESELEKIFNRIQELYKEDGNRLNNVYKMGTETSNSILVQEYVTGIELNIDLIFSGEKIEVLGLFQKAPMYGPYFAEYRSCYPTELEEKHLNECIDCAKKAVRAIGGGIGCAHVEIKYTAIGPCIIEIALRPGGAYTALAIEKLYGVNVVKELTRLLVSGDFCINKDIIYQACLYGGIVIEEEGVISKIVNLEYLEELGEVVDYKVWYKEGEHVRPLPNGSDIHLVHYILVDKDIEYLKDIDRNIRKKIKMEIRDEKEEISDNRDSKKRIYS
ncbi:MULTISPECIES: ATP-grasp domain-containing protein [unclassified Bacillus cereus group]|uniref:ATP-grasp domain-containing protein n=1 Tax=unclassified Bacillus cereus group TaxID=2750818 RepID=UPI001F57AD68|nr:MULTISPECIES: ATP-grasp domain-containing protein [unclassified Bacillus cereus group]